MGCLIRLFVLFLIPILIGLPIGVAVTAIQEYPEIPEPKTMNLREIKRFQEIALRFNSRLISLKQITKIRTTERELNTILKGTIASIPNVRTQITADPSGIHIKITIKLPANPLGAYLNIRSVIASSSKELNFSSLFVGKIEIPQQFINPFLHYVSDSITVPNKGKNIFNSFHSIEVKGPMIYLRLRPSTFPTPAL